MGAEILVGVVHNTGIAYYSERTVLYICEQFHGVAELDNMHRISVYFNSELLR